MRETLEWLTDVLVASRTASSQHRILRSAPRRYFTFEVLAHGADRRLLDLMLADQGASEWWMPVWPDGQLLTQPVAAGDFELPCSTPDRDFMASGSALLWSDAFTWDLIGIDTVSTTGLTLNQAPLRDWPVGTRLYPLRRALIAESPQEVCLNDELSLRSVTASLADRSEWPALEAAVTYFGWPVMLWRPEESDDPKSSNARLLAVVDNETALPDVTDLAGVSIRNASARWQLYGREDQSAFRSLLYTLRGRALPMWVPSWAADLRAVQNISAASATLVIERAGYTRYGRQQAGRRDIRIELLDGRVFCRRITASVESAHTEQLTLNAALGVAVKASEIRQVSFMRLSTLASDSVEIEHLADADGVAQVSLAWAEVRE